MPKRKRNANGDGAVYFSKDKNKWVGQITLGIDENGKRKRKTVYGNTSTEVKQKLKNVEFQVFTGEFVDKSGITIYHLAKQMLDDELNMNYIKENTYFRHMETLKRLKAIYNTPLQKVNETQIKAFLLSEQNYSQSTINKEFTLLKRTLREAVKRNITTSSPMADMKCPKSKKVKEKVRALTIDEQKRLFKVLTTEDVKYSRQMLLSMLTGMRMGEINALTVKDINFNFKRISVNGTISRGEKGEAVLNKTTKTEAGKRFVPITEDIKAILKECLLFKSSGLIFLTDKGGMITTNQVNAELSRILKKCAIIDDTVSGKVSLHSLRHTYATRCIEAGMQPKVLQTLLGHTDITVTMNTYCDAFENFQGDNIDLTTQYLNKLGLNIKQDISISELDRLKHS